VRRGSVDAVLFTAAFLGLAAGATAQARTYPAGVGSVSLGYQHISNTAHRMSDGFVLVSGQSRSQAVLAEITYGVSDKLTVAAGLPFVAARYTSADETPFQFLPVDADRRWHGSFQDAGISARYQLIARGPFALAPGLTLLLPSHAYDYRGEAVVGRRLRELQIGLSAARTLAEISPRLDVDASYSYAIVEKAAVAIPINRSNAGFGIGFLLTPKLQVSGATRWQRTHGGLRLGSFTGPLRVPGEVNTTDRIIEHDRLLRDNHVHLEGGLAYSIGKVDVSASYLHYLSGTDTHAGRALTFGATWFFGAVAGRGSNP
jgi:hypothetical protein